jgi:hypothetical protein
MRLVLPRDEMTARAFLQAEEPTGDMSGPLEAAARFVHETYLETALAEPRREPNLKPWKDLDPALKISNLHQAAYAEKILTAAGFIVTNAGATLDRFEFTPADEGAILQMAEMEHGRYNVERIMRGWRLGETRDDVRQLHDKLVPWAALDDRAREKDVAAVRAFPAVLAKMGKQVSRR